MTQFTSTYIQGTIDEITLASGSLSFGGTNYLNVPSSAQVTLGTGDFTIEFWIYLNNTTQNGGAFQLSSSSTYLTSSATNQLCLQLRQGYFEFGNNGGFNQGLNDATCAYSANTWYHIAMCRQSGVLRYFVNGVQKLSNVSDTTNYTGTYLGIGRFYDTPYGINGYLSNFRLTKGTALYASNFNVPQGPLPNITNTSLLLNVQPSNSFKDSSTNNFTLTNSGVTFTNVGPFNSAPPAAGTSQNIPMRQFRDGTIMISGIYDEVGSGLSYVAGLYKTTYVGYFNDVPSWFATATPGTYGSNPATSVQTTIIEEPLSDDGSNFSVQWLGYFLATTTETYTFFTSSDDASYVWVGDTAISGFTTSNAIVNNGGLHATQERSGTIALTAGTYYPIRIQFGENGGGDNMSFNYSTPTITKTTNVTGKVFYNPTTNGF